MRNPVGGVFYHPLDSVVVDRIQRAFPSDELRERALATNLAQRERKFDAVALFYTLSFGFAASSDCSIQAFLERFLEMADCEELSYSTFHGWFSPTFVALLREILDDAVENDDHRQYSVLMTNQGSDFLSGYGYRWEIESG